MIGPTSDAALTSPKVNKPTQEGHMTLIDLSAPIRPDPPDHPEPLRTEIQFDDHAQGAATIGTLFGVGAELLRDGEGWAIETFIRFGTHNSTHVDAPWHYNSTIAGRRAQTTSYGARRALRAAGLHCPRPGRHARGDPLAL
jgi:hypothetical protein